MKGLLNKNWITPKRHNPRGHYEHLKPQANKMNNKHIAYVNISRVMGVSEQVVAMILNVPERY